MFRTSLFVLAICTIGGVAAQSAANSAQTAPAATPSRTEAEVKALIQKVGATPPDWLGATALNFPKTLDLTFKQAPKGTPWDANKWMGQYLWSVINVNPSKWKEGVKLLHHTLTLNQNDPAALKKNMQALGDHYHDLFGDYARAAYWWEKAGETDYYVADCYYRLGNKDMAKAVLTKLGEDDTRHCSIIKLWGDLGETDTALKLAEKAAQEDPFHGNLAAGDVCRKARRFKEALAYYQKVVDAPRPQKKGDTDRTVKQAQESIDTIKVIEMLDLARIRDGDYSADAEGYHGRLTMTVTIKGGKIADCKVSKHTEQQFYNSIYAVPAQIIEKQGVKGVDTYSSATLTSTAIINSCVKALSGAMNGPQTAGK